MRLYTISVHRHKGKGTFQVRIMDHTRHKEGLGNHSNPAEAFRTAERQVGDRIGFIESADPAEWDDVAEET